MGSRGRLTAASSRTRLPNPNSSLPQAEASHSHIQLVTRGSPDNHPTSGRHHRNITPSFCSQSLQSASSSYIQTLRKVNPVSEGAGGPSFADMARRLPSSNNDSTERPDPLPLSGYISFKPARNRQGNKNWRTLELSSLNIDATAEDGLDVDAPSSPMAYRDPTALPDALPSSGKQNTLLQRPATENSMPQPDKVAGMGQPDERQPNSFTTQAVPPLDPRSNADPLAYLTRVFGGLPDLIHISEHTGKYDGEVVFIGHPNRNVSAHQWLAEPFQWVNVGTWSHTHRRIEGSIASDKVPSEFPRDSIEQFKFLAESREKRALELKSLKNGQKLHKDTVPSITTPSSTEETNRPVGGSSHSPTVFGIGQHLEDPFVTPAKQPRAAAVPLSMSNRKATNIGSMDFNYEFPTKPMPMDSHQPYVQGDRQRPSVMYTQSEIPTHLREVQFGEEAGSALSTPATHMKTNVPQISLSPEEMQSRLQIKNKLTELGNQPRQFSLPAEQRVAIPEMPSLNNNNIRALFPPGPTVANPYRGVSTLNAKAAPYVSQYPAAQVSDASESAPSVVTAIYAPANLVFSDPAGALERSHEVVNIDENKHTPQTFKGPYFAKSVPTTKDPVAQRTPEIGHDDKLKNWFRDGKNPPRQIDYAKSLIAAAESNDNRDKHGAVGQHLSTAQAKTQYENTGLFVRLQENLKAYTDPDTKFSPFTKAWKPAPQHLCDTTPEGNDSFFAGGMSRAGFSVRPDYATSSRLAVPSPAGSAWNGAVRGNQSRASIAATGSASRPSRWNAPSSGAK